MYRKLKKLAFLFAISQFLGVLSKERENRFHFRVSKRRPFEFVRDDEAASVFEKPEHRKPNPASFLVARPELYSTR